MAKIKLFGIALIITSVIASCDLSVPDKPDFTTAHTVEIPIINNKTYVFLGDSTGALIDTTSEDLDSLFVVDPSNGVISITADEEFDFGDLDDAIPEIDGSNTSFNSAIGEIEIGSFSSGGSDLGSTNFAEISGGATPPAGTPVPSGDNSATPVNIDIGASSDFFTSATIKNGSLDIGVTNELGFDIQTLEITLLSSGVQVGSVATFNNLSNGASETASITFSDGDELNNITVDVVITWDNFNYPASDGDLIINSAAGSNLFASSVTANIESQDFSTTSTSTFSDTEFRFTDPAHYVELSAGQISITNMANNMGIGIETLQISFPGIRNDDYGVEDSLVISFPTLPANTTATDVNIDLADYRIFANNNEVTYNIVASTENTQTGPNAGAVTISETDEITATVDISGLTIKSASGIVLAQTVLLGDNDLSNDTGSEVLDVFNETEAEITSIDGLDEFSDKIDGFKFTEPVININYNSNIGIETTIYAAMVGVDGDGNEVYLSGKAGSVNEVSAGDPISGLVANGVQLQPEQLIKFSIDNVSDCQNNTCQISFNINTTNVDDFLNNLPTDIRFIGKAVVNENENEAFITTPLEFNPMLNVDLPLAFRTEVGAPANFTDSLDFSVDLGDETEVTEGQLFILYTNNLPMGLNIFLSFRDSTTNTEIFALPNPGNELRLVASPVDDVTGFATGGQENNTFTARLTEAQLEMLDTVNLVEFSINLRSSENKAVKLRASDSFRLSLGARIKIENKIGGK
ncbi:MAG TPA: hypothetical protein DCL80_06770 [Balneola sp.]|jgi:hypothetical protein|nr:hypothetical protein [Balneola sp.]MAO78360.1 hypothetical protein [Balneola sp.]MBF64360.1 hypothetical protein [Balneola sp.]HAH50971.1 hypothetical protein [Balneola sp.]HBZ38400.1 hypothetical protein [Balneola sp.]|tara:strand:+ start:2063 stop:4318 length:2256 start_codon:yes stop_codon:yes gene_type:complete